MKTKKSILTVTGAVIFFLIALLACSKDNNNSTLNSTDKGLGQDDAYVDELYNDVDNIVSDEITTLDANGYQTTGTKSTENSVCYTVTVDHPDTTYFPKIVTIDYGTGCSEIFNGDTITRKGQIIVTVTNRWYVPNAQLIVTFNNFYVNDIKIEGTRTITNMGLNNLGHWQLGISLVNGKITFNDSTFITREANQVREWIFHLNPLNDTIKVTGTASGINILGESYTHEITSPLILIHCPDFNYRWVIVDGTITVTNSARGTYTIDYGNGQCDGWLTVSKNGVNYNYQFQYRNRHRRY